MENIPRIFEQMPDAVAGVAERLRQAGYAVWLVGGAVRDHVLGVPPADWDFSTNAPTQDILTILSPPYRVVTFGLRHGTAHVVTPDGMVEITSWALNGHGGIDKDLERRDLTINALAVSYPDGTLLDPFGGLKDLKARRLRGVVNPLERFREDPLRPLRAARLVSRYGFQVSRKTRAAMRDAAPWLRHVAVERIRDEFWKLLLGPHVMEGLDLCRRSGLMAVFLPELLEGWRKKQNSYHRYDIYRHTLLCVHHSPAQLRVRLAALLHDIGKPRVRAKVGGTYRFYGHEKQSALMARDILERWLTSKKLTDDVVLLVENHMVHDTDAWKDAAVRRLIRRVGLPLVDDLLELMRADRLAHGVPSEALNGVERLRARIRRILDEKPALSPKALAINGRDVMQVTGTPQGPEVGHILNQAFQLVLRDPAKNDRDFLLKWLEEKAMGVTS
ncbi:CCA tRNA nucleotidyltransferase [Desulfosoma caldarium]|uniref:Poly(A) polymerase/tRNA nucleotidyltransferase (CCA-adding enzyme) n=1 Tax=Desulfosoma caldarium TaxID=610254 RepID=A0A3N1V1U4_9BACT|nr:HD domain-containing protein [Desulfosoma caldarium]ROQ93466.1 poly(A) polymerase/tRNA nucleotidyltransferase (CCA-adding enzyme) [Desulfosoma caldarium]